MNDEVALAPDRLTKAAQASYARYMPDVDIVVEKKEEAPKLSLQPKGVSSEIQLGKGGHTVKNPHEGFDALAHGDGARAVSEAEQIAKEHDENLKKPNILQALWKALVEVFTKGKGLHEEGVHDALSLSEVFSEVIASQPSEDTLKLSYLNWQKLAIENKESPAVLHVAMVGLQETKNAVIAKGIDVAAFEQSAKEYYVEHEKEITIEGLKRSIPEHAITENAKGFKARVETLSQHVDETRKRNDPILPGEIFSPSLELKEIMKKSHAEKEIALAAFKEKFAYQKVGFTNLRESLLTKLSTQPDMSQADADREIMRYADTFGFDDTQLGVIAEITDSFLHKRETVKQLREEFTVDGKLDTNSLFKSVMGYEPTTTVEAFFGPISVGFVIKDTSEFKKAVREDGPIGDEAKGRIVAHVPGASALDNMVVVLSTDDPGIKVHETQHVIDALMLPLVDQAIGEKPRNPLKELLAKESDPEKQRLLVDRHLARIRDLRLEVLHTEIFAFSKQGLKTTAIDDVLLGENSAYMFDRKQELEILLASNDPKHADMLKTAFDHMVGDYTKMTQKGLLEFRKLQDQGYTQEQIFGLLGATPLKDWEKTIKRQLAEDVQKDKQPGAAEDHFKRLHDARATNVPYSVDEESALRQTRAFRMPAFTTLPLTAEIYVPEKIIDKINMAEYTNPAVRPIVREMSNLSDKVSRADLEALKTRLNALAVSDERDNALNIVTKIENSYSSFADAKKEMFAAPKRKELADLDNPHSVASKFQDAVDLIRLEASHIIQQDFTTLTPAQLEAYMHTLRQPKEAKEINPHTGTLMEAESTMSWVEELQKIVWVMERNIDEGRLGASNDQKNIIKEFANQYFDQYTTADDLKNLKRLLNQLLSATSDETDQTWVEDGLTGMYLDGSGDIRVADAMLLGIPIKELFGELVTQKRKKINRKRTMADSYELPPSFQDVVEQVIVVQAPPEYRTGGPFEIVDRKGYVNFNRLAQYAEKLMLTQHNANPKDQINLFDQVAFPGLISLTLGHLTDPKLAQFRITNNVEFTPGDSLHDRAHGFHIDKGAMNEPKSKGDNSEVNHFMDRLRGLSYYFWQIHNYSVLYTDNQTKGPAELGKMIGQLHHKNDYIDAIPHFFKMVETNTDSKKFTEKLIGNKQGNAGDAMRMAMFLYKHIDELADNQRKKGESTESYFNRNMFYKMLTNNLTEDGKRGLDDFFFTIAGEAIAGNPNSDSRGKYKEIVRAQLEAAGGAGASEDERHLITARREEAAKDPVYSIRIDTNLALAEVMTLRYKKDPTLAGLLATATDKQIQEKAEAYARQQMKDAMLAEYPAGSGKIFLESLVELDKLYPQGSASEKRRTLREDYEKWVDRYADKSIDKYSGLEQYAFNFLRLVIPETDTSKLQSSLNIFDHISKPEVLTRTVRTAIRNSIGTIFGLNDVDKTLAEEIVFSYSKPILNGFAANDKQALAFDGASKFLNEYDYLQRTMSGRGGITNPRGMKNIIHGVIPFMDWIKVDVLDDHGKLKKKTLSEWLQGGSSGQAHGLNLKDPLQEWKGIPGNIGQVWGETHVGNAAELFEDREGNILNLDKIIVQDVRGFYHIDYQAGQKLLKDRWKKIRYSIGGTGANQFPDDLESEDQQLRVRRIIRDKNGKIAGYEFGWDSRAGYIIGKPVKEIWEKMRDRRRKKDPKELGETGVADEIARATYKKEIADMIAQRLHHDTQYRERLFASDIEKFKLFYTSFARSSYDVDNHGNPIVDQPFFDKHDWDDILEAAHIKNVGIPLIGGLPLLDKLRIPGSRELALELHEMNYQIGYGLSDGVVKMFKEFFKKIGGEVQK